MTKRFATIAILCGALFAAAWGGLARAALQAQTPPPPYAEYGSGNFFFPPYEADNERMGYGKSSDHDTTVLKAGWYVDWGASGNPGHPGGAEYARTIYFNIKNTGTICGWYKAPATKASQVTFNITGTRLIQNVQAHPGALWLVGNEPDSIYNGSPIQAELYAELYHAFYTTIKAADPTAKVAVAAIVQPSPLRMEYLDKVLAHYQATYGEPFPTDLWNIHLYIFNEEHCGWGAGVPPFSSSNTGWQINFTASELLNVTAMENNLRAFRQWMYDRGYGDIPLIVTEFGVLPPPSYAGFSNSVAAQFLTNMFDMMLNATDPTTGLPADGGRLVQMWAWFSTDHNPPPGYFKYGGDLFNANGTLTVIGRAFVAQSTAHYTTYVDLQVAPPIGEVLQPGVAGVYVYNRGNVTATGVTARLTLTHFLSRTVAYSAEIPLGEIGPRYAAAPVYVNAPAQWGAYTFTVAVRAGASFTESNRTDNRLARYVIWTPDPEVTQLSASTVLVMEGGTPVTHTVTVTVVNVANGGLLRVEAGVAEGGTFVISQTRTVPSMLPGRPRPLTLTLTFPIAGIYRLTATVVVTDGSDPNPTNNQAARTLVVIPANTLHIGKTAPFVLPPDALLTYTLAVTNDSPLTLTNVVITDAMPAGAAYIGGGVREGDVIRWNLPSLAGNGASARVTFTVRPSRTLVNRHYGVQVGEVRQAGNRQVATVLQGDASALSITKSGPLASIPGALIPYTLTVVNNSPLTLTGLVITDALPPGAAYVNQGTLWPGGGTLMGNVVSWSLTSLAGNGASAQVTFAVTATETLTNARYGVRSSEGLAATGQVTVVTVISHSVMVSPGGPDVIITDTFSLSAATRLTITVPASVVSETLYFGYARLSGDGLADAPGLWFGDLRFALNAYRGSVWLPDLTLNRPLTVTVQLAAGGPADNGDARLYYRASGGAWVEAQTTCGAGNQVYSATAHTLTLPTCRLGEFALFGPLRYIYLPIVFK